MAVGIYDGKTVKGPIDSGDGNKESYIGKSGWPKWANNPISGQKVGPDAFSFDLDERDIDDSESDGYLVDKTGGICHISMSNFGGSNFDSNMYFFLDLKTVLKFNSKFRINGLRGVPKNPKELFLLVQLCHVCHYAAEVADSADGGNKDVWNNASDTLKELAVAVYTYNNGSSSGKKIFPQGAKTIVEAAGADIGIYDGKTVKGPIDSGAGSKSSYIGKTGWPSWAGKKVLSTDGFSFNLDDRDMDDSESDGYLVDPKGGICHLSMQNIGGSNIDSNMYFMFDLKTVLKLNSKFKINGLRGVPKNPKELFLLAQLCQVVHYSIQVGETAEKGSRDKAVWNGSSDQMKELAVAVYTIHNGSGGAKKLFPQGAKTIAEENNWKEIIESKIDGYMSAALQEKKEVVSERTVEEENAYQEFFQKALKKFGVESPAELKDDAEKKKFFDYVDANWKGDNEKAEGTEAQDSIKPSKKKDLAASNCGS